MSEHQRPFDLVILDLDGTIIDLYHHKPISPVVCAAIAEVQAAGVPVTIATGRTLDYVRRHVAHLGITAPVVTTQGAVIGDPVSGQVLAETSLPLTLAREVTAWIDAHPYVTGLYFLDAQGRTQIYQNHGGPEPDFYDHVFGKPRMQQTRLSELVAAVDAHPPLKFLVVGDPQDPVDLLTVLTDRFSPALTITRTHPRLVEGTAAGIDKGQGALRLCAFLGIDPQRVLAIGDSENDIPVLEAMGYAVAMGNASPSVKAVADWEAPSVEDDGAATALRRLVLRA